LNRGFDRALAQPKLERASHMSAFFHPRCFHIAAAICAVGLVTLASCSKSSQESQVSGNVTLDGKSIGPGMTVFTPVGDGKPATGSIESDGSYTLLTGREAGLTAGTYKAMVSIRELPKNMKPGDRPPPGKLLIPEKYEQVDTSGLQYEVKPGRNTIDIEMTSK
jgi:hypothetical protein